MSYQQVHVEVIDALLRHPWILEWKHYWPCVWVEVLGVCTVDSPLLEPNLASAVSLFQLPPHFVVSLSTSPPPSRSRRLDLEKMEGRNTMMGFSIVVALYHCFSVLDRPHFLSGAAATVEADDPSISNSLMAAIKRSQANQRRHPDTFHLYKQWGARLLRLSTSRLSCSIARCPPIFLCNFSAA
ncbi:hypothetical protein KSP40_PGU017067 [Platanthera guangdongensis]|uniref:Uncharacterized protein n=1 Tax=Platanthera guangdongensis TaxID=2320717 RepID=A0ABR2LZF1_9ASPA